MIEFLIAPAFLLGLMLFSHWLNPGAQAGPSAFKQGGWVQFAVAAVTAYASSRDAKKNREAQQGMSLEQMQESGRQDRKTLAFQMELQDYYTKRDKAETRRALDEFRKFSRVQGFAPGYQQTFQPDAVPQKPSIEGAPSQPAGSPGGGLISQVVQAHTQQPTNPVT